MKISILVDNYVPNQNSGRGQPSFSCLLEEGSLRMLFDLGISGLPLANARKNSIAMGGIDVIALSHGHSDHTWGLEYFEKQGAFTRETRFVCHPDALAEKRYKRSSIGIGVSEDYLKHRYNLVKTRQPYWISDRIVYLGEIERTTDFENKRSLGRQRRGEEFHDDYLLDDTALVYVGKEKISIVTGCSHSGICNIIAYAKKVAKIDGIQAIVGGLHMQNTEPDELTSMTVGYLARENIEEFYPCHCTSLFNKMEIGKVTRVKEAGVGTVIEVA